MTTITINRATVEQALEFLDAEFGWSPGEAPRIDALRTALAQQAEQQPMHPELRKMWEDHFDKCFRAIPVPEQAEPVKFWPLAPLTGYYDVGGRRVWLEKDDPFPVPAPPQRKPLTDEEIAVLEAKYAPPVHPDFADSDDWVDLIRAVERAHGIGEGS